MDDMKKEPTPLRKWGRIKQAAVYAGVEERTIREWISKGLHCPRLNQTIVLTPVRLNQKTILIRYTDIDDFLLKFVDDDSAIDEMLGDLA
jgi:hypothetical protein